MIGVEHIEDWRGKTVIDPDGEQLGKLEDVYFDSVSGTPLLIAVKSGLLGRKSTLVPVNDATVGPDHVRVTHRKEAVEGAAGVGGEGAPDDQQLAELGSAYGLKFSDRVRLESATERETNHAEAEAARLRAEQLEAEARQKSSDREAAHERADAAGDDAGRAEREAEAAREAAEQARQQADRYGPA
jgi:sporulation protein YlmC with PRC-barrel domain